MKTAMRIVSRLPVWLKTALKHFITLFYYGNKRYCPVCGHSSNRFRAWGLLSTRKEALCVHCGSLERHRFSWLFLQKKSDLFSGKQKQMLHIAPEECFEAKFKKLLGTGYITADLNDKNVMVKMDITDIQYPDRSFNVIYCSHVLEHVVDDKKALQEFYRVLKEDGWAILNVPITSTKTIEDSLITDSQERLKHFGQVDHVRRYGPDYAERLRAAGFKVDIIEVADLADPTEIISMGLTEASGEIYYCTK